MTNKTLEERIAEHKEEIRLWQESYDSHPDGANTTALHDLKNGLEIIEELLAENKTWREMVESTNQTNQAMSKMLDEMQAAIEEKDNLLKIIKNNYKLKRKPNQN